MTVRFHCLNCQATGPQSELPEHKCPAEPKPDPLEELEGQIPRRPEPGSSPISLTPSFGFREIPADQGE